MKIMYVSTFLPRRCGIATYTFDLIESLVSIDKELEPIVLCFKFENDEDPLQLIGRRARYAGLEIDVLRLIIKEKPGSYRRAINVINGSEAELVHIQHEFGIFGSHLGEYVLEFARSIEKPIVITFHTVSSNPDEKTKQIVRTLGNYCSQIIVHTEIAKRFLTVLYGFEKSRIEVIPHGTPIIKTTETDIVRLQSSLGLVGNPIITNFGFLASQKGLEYAVKALPRIVERYPKALLLVVGRTHPNEIKLRGEQYRKSLLDLARKLDVGESFSLVDRFVSRSTLFQYLLCSDIYINPYPSQNQVSSGTISYAMGCGKAIISTPFYYAVETLADSETDRAVRAAQLPRLLVGERGILVPFRNSEAIADAVILLMENPILRATLEAKARDYSDSRTTWAIVASRHLELYRKMLCAKEAPTQ